MAETARDIVAWLLIALGVASTINWFDHRHPMHLGGGIVHIVGGVLGIALESWWPLLVAFFAGLVLISVLGNPFSPAGLFKAISAGDDKSVESLLSDVSANEQDSTGWYALTLAAYDGQMAVAIQLIDAGADVNSRDPISGWTPLHVAAMNGHADIVELLLSHGADLGALDDDGRSAVDLAEEEGHTKVLDLLRK